VIEDNYDISAGGIKLDADKPRMDLLPFDSLVSVSEVLTFGSRKYSDHNWAKGMRWGRLIASCLRHISAFMQGEDNDPETGKSHIAHAACCCLMLLGLIIRNSGTDDRFTIGEKCEN